MKNDKERSVGNIVSSCLGFLSSLFLFNQEAEKSPVQSLLHKLVTIPIMFSSLIVFNQIAVRQAEGAGFTTTASLTTARYNHTATLLPSGKVLVAGGFTGFSGGFLVSTELYDPATGTWSAGGSLAAGRLGHSATLLPSGKVLVAGGFIDPGGALNSAELYNPATDSWSAAGSLATARFYHTETLLPTGKVLVTGGWDSSQVSLASAELYDPATDTWSSAGSLATGRVFHTATLLPTGEVMVAGGYNGNVGDLDSAELYDPGTNSWSAAGSLAGVRAFHTATLLTTGEVMVTGGVANTVNLNTAELYDPGTDTWSSAGSLADARNTHTATLFPGGGVLVVGGQGGSFSLPTAELYDAASDSWSSAGSLATSRFSHTATLLPSGRVLVAGGYNGAALASTELYNPGDLTPAGSGVVVNDPPTGATITFTTVTNGGTTTVNTSSTGQSAPFGFTLGNPPVYYDITTTATFSGVVTICLSYNPASFASGTDLRLLHYNGSSWDDITTSIDSQNNIICGSSNSLSPFTVMARKGALQQISDLMALVNSMNLTSSLTTSLDSYLSDATSLLNKKKPNISGACTDLSQFISLVKAQTGKKITTTQAGQLIAAATEIKTVLKCK